jgi:hypothetical protein
MLSMRRRIDACSASHTTMGKCLIFHWHKWRFQASLLLPRNTGNTLPVPPMAHLHTETVHSEAVHAHAPISAFTCHCSWVAVCASIDSASKIQYTPSVENGTGRESWPIPASRNLVKLC